MSKRNARWAGLFVVLVFSATGFSSLAYAEAPLVSPNYRFEESVLGNGGLVQSNSANYQTSGDVLGDTAVGESSSDNFSVRAGNKTSPDPTLSFIIEDGAANFGAFSAGTTATATARFSVSNYTSYGYAVQVVGDVPKNGNASIDAMADTDASIAGMKQFGLNLVANTSPSSLGANPDQGQFGFGVAAPNYATPNQYRYVSGETIATAPKTSGVTKYTMSYIVNVDGHMPGGQYNSSQTLICTGTF